MTDDGMRHIRLFQVGDLFLGQFNGQGADGIDLANVTFERSDGDTRDFCYGMRR